MKTPKPKNTSNDYLETLETVKKQYQQYLDVSELYDLPTAPQESEPEYEPPSIDNPLTTNTLRGR